LTRRWWSACAAVLLAAVWAAAPAPALETEARAGPVELRVTLSPDAPRIGDRLALEIVAVAEPGVELLMPDFGEALDRFDIVDFAPRQRVDDAGRTVATQRYTLEAPASGDHRIPSILVEFVDRRPGRPPAPEDRDAYELLTDPIPFAVASVVPDEATAELSPPLGRLDPRTAGGSWRTAWLIGLLAVAGAAAPFVWRALLRRRARAEERSAYAVARSALDELLAAEPPEEPEAIDAFFVELSGIVRRYLEARFGLRSPELTTERFLEAVSASPDLTDTHRALLRDFLSECDLVKFADVIPSRADIAQAIDAACRFVDETGAPAEEPDAGPAPAGEVDR
jgi:hypothetical protein